MCAVYRLFINNDVYDTRRIIAEIQKRYGDIAREKYLEKDIYPKSLAPVIGQDNKVALLKWGFPITGKSGVVFNARAESLTEKPMFKNSLSNRCLVPASAFYEWGGDTKKIKYEISLVDTPFFYMAGLWRAFADKDGNKEFCFTIITTAPNKQISEIHNRMPSIILPDDAENWLDTENSNALKLLKPYEYELKIS